MVIRGTPGDSGTFRKLSAAIPWLIRVFRGSSGVFRVIPGSTPDVLNCLKHPGSSPEFLSPGLIRSDSGSCPLLIRVVRELSGSCPGDVRGYPGVNFRAKPRSRHGVDPESLRSSYGLPRMRHGLHPDCQG